MSNSSTIKVDIKVDDTGAVSAIRRFSGEIDSAGRKTNAVATGMANSWKALAGAIGAVSLVAIGKQILAVADQYTLLEGRLRLVTTGTDNLRAVQDSLYQISLRTHQSQTDTITLYTRLARATDSLGLSQKDALQITESINQALIVSGALATESSAALIQLSQGLASGVLRGEEFNSVMEQTPRLAQAIADGLGVDIGQLRAMAKEGKLSADVVTRALLSQKDVIEGEFRQMTTTVSQAMTDLGTVVQDIIADANSASGATSGIATSIEDLAATIDDNRDGILSLLTSMIDLASEVVGAFANIGQSIQGAKAVASGELSFFKYMTSDAGELKKELADIVPGMKAVEDKLGDLKTKRQDVAESWAFTPAQRRAKEQELAAIDESIDALKIEKNTLEATKDKYVDSWQTAKREVASTTPVVRKHYGAVKVEADKSEKDHTKAEKKKTETTKKETENRNRYYEMYGISERAEIESLTDSWAVMERGRTENTQAQNQEIVASNEEAIGLIGEQWNTAFESIQGAISDMIYEMDFSAKSILDIFKRMLADILAAILMSGIKSALAEMLGFTNTGSIWGAFGSGISSALGGGGGGGLFGGSGGAGGTGAASGWGAVGGGLALAGGAYGMYSGASNMSKGNAGVGAAQMGMGAVSAYKGAVTLGLIEKGTATGVYNAMAAKITGAGVESAITTGTTQALGGTASGATASATTTGGAAAGSGGMAAGAAAGAAYAIPALAAALVAMGAINKANRPSAAAEIDQYGITPDMLGNFTSGMQAVQGSILDAVPTLAKYEAAQYSAEHSLLALTGSTGTLALRYDETAAAGHQWSTALVAGSSALHEAITATDNYAQAMRQVDGETNTSIESMRAEIASVSALGSIMNETVAGTQSMENAIAGLGGVVGAAANQMVAAGSTISNALDLSYRIATWSPGTQSMENHADGGIFPGVTIWGSHRIGEAGTEALIPLPDGPDTMSKIIDRLDRIEARQSQMIVVNIAGTEVKRVINPMVDAVVAARQSRGVSGRAYIP